MQSSATCYNYPKFTENFSVLEMCCYCHSSYLPLVCIILLIKIYQICNRRTVSPLRRYFYLKYGTPDIVRMQHWAYIQETNICRQFHSQTCFVSVPWFCYLMYWPTITQTIAPHQFSQLCQLKCLLQWWTWCAIFNVATQLQCSARNVVFI